MSERIYRSIPTWMAPPPASEVIETTREQIQRDMATIMEISGVGTLQNPKDLEGVKKVPLHLNPATAAAHQAMAMSYGAEKYGPFNWRDKAVVMSVYVAAMKRHLDLFFDAGENVDADSGLHHLGHVMAGAAILLDAIELENVHDDRPKPSHLTRLYERMKKKPGAKAAPDVEDVEDDFEGVGKSTVGEVFG